jgi:hypothetical protein
MELQDFGPVAQSKELFTQAASSKLQSNKLVAITLVALITGVAIGYIFWKEHNILLSKIVPSKELKS